ncbi:MAG: hypothetical protein ACO3IT_07440 [Ilumatobacteraceae bacterium]
MQIVSNLGIGTRGLLPYKGQGWPFVLEYKSRIESDGGYYEGISCLLRKLNNL